MPVAGLSLTLNQDEALASAAVAQLYSRDEVQLGEMDGRYIAAVTDTPDPAGSRDLHRWIESLPGIDFTDVVYVGFDEQRSPSAANSGQTCSTPTL